MANTRRNRLWTDGVEHWLTRGGEGYGLRDGALANRERRRTEGVEHWLTQGRRRTWTDGVEHWLTQREEGLREWNTG